MSYNAAASRWRLTAMRGMRPAQEALDKKRPNKMRW
jgi:hypothetical protein